MDNSDPRVELFVFGWFSDKAVLDIGCNSGFFTISLYNRYHPSKIVGMDIDSHLINTARKNLRYSIDRESKVDLLAVSPTYIKIQ
jgi:7SK snRNA methylphosphate capping enzyme